VAVLIDEERVEAPGGASTRRLGVTIDSVPQASPSSAVKPDIRSFGRSSIREAMAPALVTLLVVTTGMAYSLWWPSVGRHQGWYWLIPGDIWLEVRDAHYVGWGGLSFVYSAHTALVTLPGFSVVMWPVVTLCSALGFSESSPFLQLTKPEAWLLIGPFTFAMVGVALFSLNALARRLAVPNHFRYFLILVESVGLWSTVVIWGHPEDVVALGFATYALVFLLDRRWTGAGWLFGIAIAMQLYVIALVPIVIALVGWRKVGALLARSAVVPGFFLVAVLVPNFHRSISALLNQPNYPTANFPTPWVLLAPKISKYAVAAGTGRIIGFAVAVALAVPAYRWRGNPAAIVWLAAAALGARCLFESVMDPYYVMPAVALALVAGATRGPIRGTLTFAAGIGLTVMVFSHPGMWAYWFEMAGLTGAMLGFAWPRSVSKTATSSPEGEHIVELADSTPVVSLLTPG
jgi:hypothetical protein